MQGQHTSRWRNFIAGALALVGAASANAGYKDKCADPTKFACVQIVSASASSATATVSADPVNVPKNATVIWTLPQGYVFDPGASTGVIFNYVDEVDNAGPADDDGDATSALTRRYKIKLKKLLKGDQGTPGSYKYTLVFFEMNGGYPTKKLVCDPTIANSAGFDSTSLKRQRAAEVKAGPIATAVTLNCTVSDVALRAR